MTRKKRLGKAPHPSQKVMDVMPHKGFPKRGATLSAYSPLTKGSANTRVSRTQAVKAAKKLHRRQKIKRFLKFTTITLLIVSLLVGGWVGWKFVRNTGKVFGGNVFDLFRNTKLKGEDTGRVNILLAGNSADDPGHAGGTLTDSMMLVSLDVKNNTGFMMSIPRDLWVDIPDVGYAKINAAYVHGQANKYSKPGYPAGGMGLLQEVVSRDFGLPIHYYGLVNYTAFQEAVDAVGGIDVNIQSNDPRGLYDPNVDWSTGKPLVKLTNGTHHLNGREALNLARARGNAYNSYGFAKGDFQRAANQRLMLVALKDKSTSLSTFSNPAKITKLLDTFGKNVETDFQAKELRRLHDIVKKINSSKIQSISLNDVNGKNYLQSYRGYGGQSALIPAAGLDNFTEIQAYIDQLSSPPPTNPNN